MSDVRSYATSEALRRAASAVPAIGASDPSYAGVSVDPVTNTLHIHRVQTASETAADSAIEDRYRGVVPAGVVLAFEPALLTSADIDELNAIMESSMAEFDAAGYEPSHWGPEGGYRVFTIGCYGNDSPPDVVRDKFAKFLDRGVIRFAPTGAVGLVASLDRRPVVDE